MNESTPFDILMKQRCNQNKQRIKIIHLMLKVSATSTLLCLWLLFSSGHSLGNVSQLQTFNAMTLNEYAWSLGISRERRVLEYSTTSPLAEKFTMDDNNQYQVHTAASRVNQAMLDRYIKSVVPSSLDHQFQYYSWKATGGGGQEEVVELYQPGYDYPARFVISQDADGGNKKASGVA